MSVVPRRIAATVLPLLCAVLVGCSTNSAGTGSGSDAAGSATDAGSAAVASDSGSAGAVATSAGAAQPTAQAPVTMVKTSTHAPQPVSSTNKANAGQFAGDWKGSDGRTLEVSGDESANVAYPAGVACASGTSSPVPCDQDSATPGGMVKLHIDMIVTTGDTAVATAEVKDSNDPKFTEGSLVKLTLRGGMISSPFGSFAKV